MRFPTHLSLRRALIVAATAVCLVVPASVSAAPQVQSDSPAESGGPPILFPVDTPITEMIDSWGFPRSGGRRHVGTDIMAPQMTPIRAAMGGEVIRAHGEECQDGIPCSSYTLAIAGDDGRGYFYVHLNNDTPGRPQGCDGLGGLRHAYAPALLRHHALNGTFEGARVEAGDLIGYNGSSGNASCGQDHLHFEIWSTPDWGSMTNINPYPELADALEAESGAARSALEVRSLLR
ncbi:M23 family metallopeptidase [Euzebya tangerina]|uniref:M23 family metallopeptidase n=1 Tax=Euzebya tangerina TaxID=591198 RepID=UPI0013C3406D|nr:M23 family metallopeptidase [Euzebya tangerina]